MSTDILGPADAPNFTTSRPADDRTIGATDTWMKDCSAPNVNDGTKLKASLFNSILGNLRGLVRGNGNTGGGPAVVTEDNADDMLLRGVEHLIQRGQTRYGVDSGAVNALVVSLTPALAEYKAGLKIRVLAANNNTGAATININGLGAKAVARRDGSVLLDSDIVSGAIQDYVYDGTKFQLVGAVGKPPVTRNINIYVDGAIGNDANDGVSDTSGHAMATLQAAVNRAYSYPPSQYTITIHVADGTYVGVSTPTYSGPNVIITGNAATPANVIIDGTTVGPAIALHGPNTLTAQNLKVQTTASNSAFGFQSTPGATLTTINTESGVCSNPVFTCSGGLLVPGNHKFSANCEGFFYTTNNGFMSLNTGVVFTVGAALTVSVATVQASDCGVLQCSVPAPTFVNPSNVTGKRYANQLNGVCNTQGSGASYFPGTVAGTTATGGQYS